VPRSPNNARWCDAVCRSHGHPGVFTERMWVSARHAVPFYPNAITLSPDVTAAETGADQDPSRPYGVKDSFARLDLAPAGMAPLFDAEWIAFLQAPQGSAEDGLRWDSVTDPGELARWETAWAGGDPAALSGLSGPARLFQPALLDDPRCAVLVGRRAGVLVAGAIAYTAARVTGISNVFKAGPLRASTLRASVLWASALGAVAALRPGLPVVGYEHGEDLVAAGKAGCRILGPLRVWTRVPDVNQP
jgi:hypothetical protein